MTLWLPQAQQDKAHSSSVQKRDAPTCFWRMFNTMLSTRDHHSADPPQNHSAHLQIRLHCVPRLMLPVRFQSNYKSAAEQGNINDSAVCNVVKLCKRGAALHRPLPRLMQRQNQPAVCEG